MGTIIKAIPHKHGWAIQRGDTIGNEIYLNQDVAIQLASIEQFEYELADILYQNKQCTIH